MNIKYIKLSISQQFHIGVFNIFVKELQLISHQCFLKCGLYWNGCGYGLGSRSPGWLEAQSMMAVGARVGNCPEEERTSPVTANWPGTWSATILAVSSLCVGYRSWMYYFDLIVVADGLKGWVRLARILKVLDCFVGRGLEGAGYAFCPMVERQWQEWALAYQAYWMWSSVETRWGWGG